MDTIDQQPRSYRSMVFDLIMTAVALVLFWLIVFDSSTFDAGTRNTGVMTPQAVCWLVAWFGMSSGGVVVMLIWLAASWRRRVLFARVCGLLAMVIVPVVLWWGIHHFSEPGYLPYTRGFVIWSQNNASITMLDSHRATLVNVAAVAEDRQSIGDAVDVPRDQWPPAIQQLSPSYIWVYSDDSIDFVWGGGFGHWGLFLHGHDPPRTYSPWSAYVLEVEPGLDAWYQLDE